MAAIVVSIVASNFFMFRAFNKPTVVYFETSTLFQNFKMAKETELSLETEYKKRRAIVDSLSDVLQQNSASNNKDYYLNHFLEERENLESYIQNSGAEASKKIWARINSYTKDFAELHDYKVIISSNNNEGQVYGNVDLNVTDALTNYINKRYEGIN